MKISAIPALESNYIWLAESGSDAAIVDPGSAEPAIKKCEEKNLTLRAILVTHRHDDHVAGIPGLLEKYPDAKVYAPKNLVFKFKYTPVAEPAKVEIAELGVTFSVLDTPGHTNDHIAYYTEGHLFCGDTLFGCGCGKLFEGSAKDLSISLQKLSKLPDDTLIYCGHEMTLDNIPFALAADPNNAKIKLREKQDTLKRNNGEPTMPSTLELEKETNPFLRWQAHAIKSKAEKRLGKRPEHIHEILGALRKWKDGFGKD